MTAPASSRRKTATKPPKHIPVKNLAGVKPQQVDWLWPGYLPRGKVIILEGDPGAAKSTLTCDLAARITRGRPWPDGSKGGKPANVLLLSAEDTAEDTIVPRLLAADADLRRVDLLEGIPVTEAEGGGERMVTLPRDIPEIEKIVVAKKVAFMVVDVLMAYLDGDAYRDQSVRKMFNQLASMAARTGCTIILIRHLSKAKASSIYRGGGSIGIVGAARGAYLIDRDPTDDTRRIIKVVKLNIAKEPPWRAYHLVDTMVADGQGEAARLEWEPDPVSPSSVPASPDPEPTETELCLEWLIDYLDNAGGEAKRSDVISDGVKNGWSERMLKYARVRGDIQATRSGFQGGTLWSLPE